jgi:CubicO group peptidase (beta-lactamase class C family)
VGSYGGKRLMKNVLNSYFLNNILSIILLILFATNVIAQEKNPSPQLQRWIKNLMREYHIPGASIVVIKDYRIEWAKGFGTRNKENNLPVTNGTLFQAASISKPVTAIAALEAFSNKQISINKNINDELTSWRIPPSPYTQKQFVTLRLLLSHTAGITGVRETGYPANKRFPNLLEILNGESPANTPPVIMVREPNTEYEYSPASYTIVQAVLSDIYQQPFDKMMQDLILIPLHMENSTFIQPLPKTLYKNMAWPYLPNGVIPPNSPYAFPQAAGGLWTTASDLAKFVIAIQKALAGHVQDGITPQIVKEMMMPGLNHNMGMGMEVNINQYGEMTNKNGKYFRHAGSQTGYLCMLVGSKVGGNGIVLMTNSGPYMTEKEVKQYAFLVKTIKHISQIEKWK